MRYLFFWIQALLGTAALYLWGPKIHPLLLLPIAIGFFLGLCILFVLYLVVTSLMFSKEPPKRPNRFASLTVRLALPWFALLLGSRITTRGKEKMPKEHAIYVSNHRSAFDPVFIMSAFPHRRTAFVSKLSVEKYPFIGAYMRACGYVFVDRESPMQALRALHRAAKYVKETKMNYGVFPEGTRSRDGKLLPFKEGAFVLAKKSDTPIVVMTVEGSENAISRLPFHLPRIRVTVHGVIPVEEVRALSVQELAERARAMMAAYLEG